MECKACHLLLVIFAIGSLTSCLRQDDAATRRKKADGSDASAQAEQGGVIDGNTGELITTEHNPWFTGKRTVTYCVAVGPGLSLPVDKVEAAVQDAFAVWRTVLGSLVEMGSTPTDFALPPDKAALVLARDFKEIPCAADPELTFKAGLMDAAVEAAREFTAAKTVGFALRTSYDTKTGDGKGFIWLVPDQGDERYKGPAVTPTFWSSDNVLYNVLLHEIGHVLGFPHLKGTFMDAGFPAAVVAKGLASKWDGQEMALLKEFPGDFCGSIAGADGNFLSEALGIKATQGVQLCTHYAPHLAGRGDVYALELDFTLPDGSKRQHIVDAGSFEGDESNVTGQYPQLSAGIMGLAPFTFIHLQTKSIFRGELSVAGANPAVTYPILIERTKPGLIAFRVPYAGKWSLFVMLASPSLERLQTLWTTLGNDE